MQGIYVWTVPRTVDAGPVYYVGQATDLERRRKEYLRDWQREKPRTNYNLHRAACAAPVSPRFTVVEEVTSIADLNRREYYWFTRLVERYGRDRVLNSKEPADPHRLGGRIEDNESTPIRTVRPV